MRVKVTWSAVQQRKQINGARSRGGEQGSYLVGRYPAGRSFSQPVTDRHARWCPRAEVPPPRHHTTAPSTTFGRTAATTQTAPAQRGSSQMRVGGQPTTASTLAGMLGVAQ